MNWGYVAGFFDGEGSLTHNGSGFRVTIPQTHLIVLKAIKNFSGVGNVFALTKRKAHWKDAWAYNISRQEDIQFFLTKIQPFLIVKFQKVSRVLPRITIIVAEQKRRSRHAHKLKYAVRKLRKAGLVWREIGRRLGIDFGYARRLYLSPLSVEIPD